jgi:HPt (histidine-containing phosphotransfer) domain-containing protein
MNAKPWEARQMSEEELRQYVDTEKALGRIRGNKKLFKTLLTHFLATRAQFDQLKAEIAANDREAAAKTIHALKGVSANLSMTKLYELSPPFEVLVKSGADVSVALSGYEAAYDKTLECVNILLQEPA